MLILRCVWVLLLYIAMTDAATVYTYPVKSCSGVPSNEFRDVKPGDCTTFLGQSAVQVTGIDPPFHVGTYNQMECSAGDDVGDFEGPVCVVQGHTPLQAVKFWIP
jgi:hypothetical protein